MNERARFRSSPRLRRPAVTVAATIACALAMPASPARAEFYSFFGTVFTDPVDLFPIDTGQAVQDLGAGNTLYVGFFDGGSFSALPGAVLSVGMLSIADAAAASGVTLLSGAQMSLTSTTQNRLQVGNWGSGSLLVSDGGRVDAGLDIGACTGCYSFIGQAAGSDALLSVSGAGSEVVTVRGLTVGGVAVYTQATSGFDFGTPGAATTADVEVLAGATLRTQAPLIGVGATGPGRLGTERSFASVVVDGAGSQWIVTRDTVDGRNAYLGIGNAAGATGSVTVSGGGLLRVDASGSTFSVDGINVGSVGTASLTVTGAGSRLEVVNSRNGYIQVGLSGTTANGTLNVLDGASAQSLTLNVGLGGGTGTMLIDGPGSSVILSGAGTQSTASAYIGRASANGSLTISHGGRLSINDGGMDTRSLFNPSLHIGQFGGTGSVTVTGAGSLLQITSTSKNPLPGTFDNYNPFLTLGQQAGGNGSMLISDGGILQMTGNAVSTPSNQRATYFAVAGSSDSATAGTGSVTVTGAGSQLRVEGVDAVITVGRNGTGSMTLSDRALLATTSLNIGRAGVSMGTLTSDHAFIELSGQFTGGSQGGAGLAVGNGGGSGSASFDHGSQVKITNMGSSGPSISLGGTTNLPGGHGQLTLAGGSTIQVVGAPGRASFTVGREGSGNASLAEASQIDIGDGQVHVARFAGSSGWLGIAGGSSVLSGQINIAGSSDTTPGGTGSVQVSGTGSELRASGDSGFIGVGRSGTGTLTVNSGGLVSGIVMNVGRADGGTGTLTMDNARIVLSGQQATGSFTGAALTIGNRGGSGSATLDHGSEVSIGNTGSSSIGLNLGGTPTNPQGFGTLAVNGGSRITLKAAPGQANVRIGYDGNAFATFDGGSRLDVTGGNAVIGSQPGSRGILTLNGGSSLAASYVGVGSNPGYVDGGLGSLLVNAGSTVTAALVDIGAQGLVGGNGGVIVGQVVNRGVFSPGNSPGRLMIDGGLEARDGSQLLLDVQADGQGGYLLDQIVFTPTSHYAFDHLGITFRFLGSTDPAAAGRAGVMNMDSFMRVATAAGDAGLSSLFDKGQTWSTQLAGASFGATSDSYSITDLKLSADGVGTLSFDVTAVPEPSRWLLSLGGLLAMAGIRRRSTR